MFTSPGRSPIGITRAGKVTVAERRARAIKLRLAGATLQSIADALGYRGGRSAVSIDIRRALNQALAEQNRNADALRMEELMRLDEIQKGLWRDGTRGDVDAARTLLQISSHRSKLLGLFAQPLAESPEDWDRREAVRRQGGALAEIVRRFITLMGMDERDPRVWQALRDAVREVTGVQATPTTITVEPVVAIEAAEAEETQEVEEP